MKTLSDQEAAQVLERGQALADVFITAINKKFEEESIDPTIGGSILAVAVTHFEVFAAGVIAMITDSTVAYDKFLETTANLRAKSVTRGRELVKKVLEEDDEGRPQQTN